MSIEVKTKGRYPQGQPSYRIAVGCEVHGPVEGREKAAAAVQMAMTSPDVGTVEGWLAELSVLVRPRRTDEFTAELTLTAYASRLAAYPADVVREVLLGRSWEWWPSWRELEQVCEQLVAPRRLMLAALTRSAAAEGTERPRQARVTAKSASQIMREFGYLRGEEQQEGESL